MKPPICEVCNDRFDDTDDSLVSFVVDAKTTAFDKRAEDDGFVGHRPNTGWFCPKHIDAARARADTMALGAALRDIRDAPAPNASAVSPELFDLSPDLEGVSLHGGVIRRSSEEGKSAILWELTAVKNARALQSFLGLVPVLFDQLGLGPAPELIASTRRSWDPMDGAKPPDCPYVDYVRHEALRADGRPAVSVESNQAHWNDHDISNVSANLFVNTEGGRVSAWTSGRDQHDACTSLTLLRPTSAMVIDAITDAFAEWLQPAAQ